MFQTGVAVSGKSPIRHTSHDFHRGGFQVDSVLVPNIDNDQDGLEMMLRKQQRLRLPCLYRICTCNHLFSSHINLNS